MTKQYTVTVNGTAYEVTVESVSGGRMASARGSRCPQGRSRRFRLR